MVKTLSSTLATPRPAKAIAARRRTDRTSLRVVAIGGGTGLSTLLRGLRRFVSSPHQSSADCENAPCLISDLAAVVTVTDDGGSSGRLRRGFNMLPPGDLRNCMVALADDELSIGDYVLTNGALPAMVVIDAVARLLPGVLGDDDSSRDESFSHGLLEYPQYTRPAEFRGIKVPEVLLNGNHAEIEKWRREQAESRTKEQRPDLLK